MNSSIGLQISDPTYQPAGSISWAERVGRRFILDPRDLPFLWLMLSSTVVVLPLAALLFVRFRWDLAALYALVNALGFLDRYILMLHNTSHRPLFRPAYRWMNHYIPWVLGPFFGETPETYFAHHLGMHHPENNLSGDLSSTMRYQRDRPTHFLHYFGRFYLTGMIELVVYLRRKGRGRMARTTVVGEAAFLAVAVGLLWVNWRASLVVFLAPHLVVRFLMMAGNWGQHAFIDPARPENCFVNSITCINTRYNRRCFNDGYHIGHHLKANRHWTEMPGDFSQNLGAYAREGAIVFEGIDFFQVWLYLMLGRYRALARRYVPLGEARPTEDEIVALLRSRTRPIPLAA